MALYMLKIVTLTQNITFWDICKVLRNEERIYRKLYAKFGPYTAEIRQVKNWIIFNWHCTLWTWIIAHMKLFPFV